MTIRRRSPATLPKQNRSRPTCSSTYRASSVTPRSTRCWRTACCRRSSRDAAATTGCASGLSAARRARRRIRWACSRSRRPTSTRRRRSSRCSRRTCTRARCATAGTGCTPETIEAEVSEERLRRFFTRETGGYRVRRELRDIIVFAAHNVLKDPPFTQIDLISSRNMLIYLKREVQQQVFGLFHYALARRWLPAAGLGRDRGRARLLPRENKEHRLYRRRNYRDERAAARSSRCRSPRTVALAAMPSVQAPPRLPGFGALHARIVEQYAPPSILVNEDHAIVHYSRHGGRYLRHPGGDADDQHLQPDPGGAAHRAARRTARRAHRRPLDVAADQGGPRRRGSQRRRERARDGRA